MSSPSNSNPQFSDASSVSTSDTSSLRERGVYEASGDDDSSVFTVIGDLDTTVTPSPVGSQTDLSGSLEQSMSEARLRQLYDEEEIERYLHLFSAYVTEVRLPGALRSIKAKPSSSSLHLPQLPTPPPLPPRPFARNISEQTEPPTLLPSTIPPGQADPSWSEHIAIKYILPALPPMPHPPPSFSLKRLKLTSQRFFLAVVPPYQTFFLSMANLALWKDPQRSGLYCAAFWGLWLYDLLLPAIMFGILWEMLSRRLLPYPTLESLQMRRKDSERAREFGDEVQERLSAPSLGPKDIFQFLKSHRSAAKSKTKTLPKDTGVLQTSLNGDGGEDEVATVLDGDTQEEQDIKRELLHALNTVADIHERIKNVFIWRRPAVSRRYAIILAVVACCTLIIPAHYLAKLVYGSCGLLFWHVTPVLAALPPGARARLPGPLTDAPTDADYAIEIITQRIARGEEIKPPRKPHSSSPRANSTNEADLSAISTPDASSRSQMQTNDGVDWKKWGSRIAHGKSLLSEGKQRFSSGQVNTIGLTSATLRDEDTHTYPAHHTSAPGLITLTTTTVYFTTLASQQAKLIIPRGNLCGVKKTGLMKGLLISWFDGEEGHGKEIEEKFHWVGNRDELFARLLGPDGARWMRI
ncbi:uncharacterized protein F5891DRAFT_422392 [Suillus fuscotomentosus]|uniref:Uncharacterized protein n=1 Tax=Suillus fuscotomentosus TaxID=1912939 RepID=A0AAD4E3V0_9AGAM|nr:uncharacterized protein F5891DRAFT_422392 [Suillus fuscotomentosus]KAG1899244.1 hypothetical protein F5891DRAFT_422392 [Suillus fuscotomentosus]